jgi:hypothetical protein
MRQKQSDPLAVPRGTGYEKTERKNQDLLGAHDGTSDIFWRQILEPVIKRSVWMLGL